MDSLALSPIFRGCISLLLLAALCGCASTPGREQPLGYVVSTAFSPDGKLVAAVTGESEVALFDAHPLWFRSLLTRESDKTPISGGYINMIASVYKPLPLAFSMDGTLLAAGGVAGNIVVWNVQSGTEVFRVVAGGPVAGIAFFPNGQSFITAEPAVVLRSTKDGERIREYALPPGTKATAVTVTPDSAVVVVGLSSGEIALMDSVNGQQLRLLKAHKAPVTGLAFAPDGTALASNAGGYDLRLWKRGEAGEFEKSTAPVGPESAADTLDRAQGLGALLWLLGTLRGIQIVGAPTMGAPPIVGGAESQLDKAARTTPFHCGARVAFSANGRYLASTANLMMCPDCIGTLSPAFLLFFTDLDSGKTTTVRDLGCEVSVSPDGRLFATGGPGAPQIRDAATGQRLPAASR